MPGRLDLLPTKGLTDVQDQFQSTLKKRTEKSIGGVRNVEKTENR